jgi:guanylate kinase
MIPNFADKSHNDRLYASGRYRCNLYIVSAPSGAGKTSLCQNVLKHFNDMQYSVSYTTRKPRQGEIQGCDYFFISKPDFEKGIQTGRWAEWAEVHGHYYGTSERQIRETLESGRDILMDIDVQGTCQMIKRFPRAITFFIMPPSEGELKNRLEFRGTDDAQTVALRIENARMEMAQKEKYHHIIVNDDLSRASGELIGLIQQYRCRRLASD